MNYDEWKDELNRTFPEQEKNTMADPADQTAETNFDVAGHAEENNAGMTGQVEETNAGTPAQADETNTGMAGRTMDNIAASDGMTATETTASDGMTAAGTTVSDGQVNATSNNGTAPAEQTAAGQNAQSESVTYSWVNPKLQTERSRDDVHADRSDYQWRASDSQSRAAGQTSDGTAGGNNGTQRSTYQTGGNSSSYSSSAASDRRVKKPQGRKPVSGGKKWMRMIAMALVFGLVAGSVMFGVNRAGNALFGSGAQKADTAAAKSFNKVETTKTSESTDNLDEALNASTKTEGDAAYAGTVAEVAANAMPSLVTISTMSVQEMQSFFGGTQQYEVEGAGTGVIVGQNDTELLIATNEHVVSGATEVTVGFADEQAVEAFIKGTDPSNDLAVVGVRLEDIPQETMDKIKVVAIGNSDDLVLGEQVVVIGNALGIGQSVTSGYISGFDRELELSDETGMNTLVSSGLIQTDAAINAGNSGGALLNMRGELVGINEAKSSSAGGATVDNVGYSIPISKAEPILQELMTLETKDKVSEEEKGYLGIRCADVNQETSQRYNIPVGVYVREIGENSPAAEAGLMEGDVITKIDGKIVSQYADLEAALNYCKAGETIEVIVQRQANGTYEEQTLSVTLGKQAVLDNLSSDEETQRNVQAGPNGD